MVPNCHSTLFDAAASTGYHSHPVGWQVIEQNGRQYTGWQVADYTVGWHTTSAYLDQPGNTIMAGQNSINGEVFRDFVNVEIGDGLWHMPAIRSSNIRTDYES